MLGYFLQVLRSNLTSAPWFGTPSSSLGYASKHQTSDILWTRSGGSFGDREPRLLYPWQRHVVLNCQAFIFKRPNFGSVHVMAARGDCMPELYAFLDRK